MNEEDLITLNNLVEPSLLFAVRRARRRIPMHMADWIARLDAFLTLNEGVILTYAGKISPELALAPAEQEYDKFHFKRQIEAGKQEGVFEKALKALTDGESKDSGQIVQRKPKKYF